LTFLLEKREDFWSDHRLVVVIQVQCGMQREEKQ
jgi:hypothetical protein